MEIIKMTQISKSFGTTKAIIDASFSLNKSEIHAILGENGAGKTTLLKVLYGMIPADTGKIYFNGEPISIKTTKQAIDLGIGMVHQHFMLIPVLSVAENIVIGNEPVKGITFDFKQAVKEVEALCQRSGITVDPLAKVEDLSIGEKQKVEILKALYRNVDVLILDEPTAVLTPIEVTELFASLTLLKEAGKSIIIITHKLQEIMEIAERVTIMRDGQTINTVSIEEASPNRLAEMMVGREVALNEVRRSQSVGEVIFEVKHLNLTVDNQQILKDINLSLHAGEILGIAGIEGNGQTELIEVLTGITKAEDSELILEGDVVVGDASDFIARGIGHVPEDRMTRGLVMSMNMIENVILGYEKKSTFVRKGLINWKKAQSYAQKMVERFDVRPNQPELRLSSLSGGNQQKVVIARVFGQDNKVVICAQPTRGVDVSAIETIHRIMLDYRDQGKAILLLSADLEEVKKLSDRISVMYKGEIVATDKTDNFDDTRLGLLMTSGVERTNDEK